MASLRAKVDKYSKSLGEKVIVIQLTALLRDPLQVAILNRCQNFKSSITENLLTQDEINMFKEINRYKTSKEITLKYSQKHVKILEHSFNICAKINEKMYKLNPLIFISLPLCPTVSFVLSETIIEFFNLQFVDALFCIFCGFRVAGPTTM